MAGSNLEIWNMALATAGSQVTVSDETEQSPQANTVRLFYDEVRTFVNTQAPWGFALDWARLAVKAERDFDEAWTNTDPAPGWRYAYSLPNGMLSPFYLQTFSPFEIGLNQGAPALFTNQEQAVLRFVRDQPNVGYWGPEFTNAVISLLAFRISPVVNAKLARRDRLREEAFEFILDARTQAANDEVSQDYEILPEAINARGYSGQVGTTNFYYQFANLNGTML